MSAVQQLLTEHLDIWMAADTEKKSGRGRASSNAGNVYGIRKLRELIFELAALGRLVDEDIHQPAKHVQLGEVAEFIMGQAPPGSECNTNGIGTIFVKTGEFGSQYPEVCEWTTKPLKFAKAGDVLICVVGATVGKLNLAIDCAIGRSVAAIRPVAQLETKYIYFALMPFTLRLRAQSRGSAQGVIGKAELNAVQIRLPSVDEQHRIVSKVDELMALCDQLETQHNNATEAHEKLVIHLLGTLTQSQSAADFSANWHRIAAHFDTLFTTEASIDVLKQTLLQLAVMGKLVPQDPNDEPASALLKRIQAEKAKLIAEGKIKKDKPIDLISDEEKPFELPKGWQWIKCQDICLKITDGEHATPRRSESGHYLLSARNVTNEGIILDDVDYVPLDEFQRIRNRCDPNIGDILISCSGSVGRVAVVDKDNTYSMVRSAAMIRPNNNWLCKEYLVSLLRSVYLQDQMKKRSKQSAQANLFLGAISNLVLIIPPLAEQQRIVNKIDELMEVCGQLKICITEGNQLRQKFADVLVEKAVA